MEASTQKWIKLITDMLEDFETEIKFTLDGINNEFQTCGLSFDDDFRNHFLQIIAKRVAKTYDHYQMNLNFEVEKRSDVNLLLGVWSKSSDSGFQGQLSPIVPATKRKYSDQYSSNRTFLVKRRRYDGNVNNAKNDYLANDDDSAMEDDLIEEDEEEVDELDDDAESVVKSYGYIEEIPDMNDDSGVKGNENNSEYDENDDEVAKHNEVDKTTTLPSETSDDNRTMDMNIEATDGRDDNVCDVISTASTVQIPDGANPGGVTEIPSFPNNQDDPKSPKDKPIEKRKFGPAPASVKRARLKLFKSTCEKLNVSEVSVEKKPKLTARRSLQNFEALHQCTECDKKFYHKNRLEKHILEHTKFPHRCTKCRKKFAEPELLDLHMIVHKKKCKNCGEKFMDEMALEEHKQNCGTRSYECYLCKRVCKTNEHLKRHIQTHIGDRSHPCQQCSKKFTSKSNLNKHMTNIHSKIFFGNFTK